MRGVDAGSASVGLTQTSDLEPDGSVRTIASGNFADAIFSSDGRRIDGAANSVFILGPGGKVVGRYDKAHLVPYGEYLPMRPLLSAIGLSRLAPGDIDFNPGPPPLDPDPGYTLPIEPPATE